MIHSISSLFRKEPLQPTERVLLACDLALTASLCLMALSSDWNRYAGGGSVISGRSLGLWMLTGASGEALFAADFSTTPWPVNEGKGLSWGEQHVPTRALRRTPAQATPTRQEEVAASELNILDLVKIAERVGCSTETRHRLNEWLTKVVPFPKEYLVVGAGQQELARQELRRYLCLMALEMQRADSPLSQRLLTKLADHSSACAPTWLRVAEEGYQELKGASGLEQRLLRYVTAIKRDLVQEDLYRGDDRYFPKADDWHLESRVIHQAGAELGIPPLETMYYDSTVSHQPMKDREFRRRAFQLASDLFLRETFVQRLVPKLEMDAPKNGLDPEVTQYLSDGDAARWDNALASYYIAHNGVYRLNEAGARKLLELIGYC